MEKKSILIVEDEKIPAVDLKDILTSLGYRITGIASSGERAIKMTDEDIPDLILMDIQLSGKLTGIEAAEQILQRHSIPIIYLTAYADPELVERAKRTRPYGYIIKPYDERAIRTEIEIALYKAELDQNLKREYENLEQRVIDRTHDLTRINAALQKSETRYRLIFERSGEGIFIFQADGADQGKIVEVNAAGAAMHGYQPEELLSLKITDLDVVDNLTAAPSRFDAILSGKWIGGVVNHVKKDGTVFPVYFSAGLLELEGHNYVFSFIRDISERIRAEDALRMANKKLTLLSGITRHDIRNQLMALKSYIYLSKNNLENPGQLVEYLHKEGMIADNIERQINFTQDYEDLGVKLPLWQNIEAIVNRALSQHQLREIRVETVCPGVEIYADPLLEKVFFNLIDNALKYGGEGMTTIRVTSEVSENGLVISVQDDGGGISADDKKKLFERGFGHHTGLGLFLSREILSITGITITETGEPGKGARFEILVPKDGYRFSDAAIKRYVQK